MNNNKCNIINAKAYEELDKEIERLENIIEMKSDVYNEDITWARIQGILWAKRIFYPEW